MDASMKFDGIYLINVSRWLDVKYSHAWQCSRKLEEQRQMLTRGVIMHCLHKSHHPCSATVALIKSLHVFPALLPHATPDHFPIQPLPANYATTPMPYYNGTCFEAGKTTPGKSCGGAELDVLLILLEELSIACLKVWERTRSSERLRFAVGVFLFRVFLVLFSGSVAVVVDPKLLAPSSYNKIVIALSLSLCYAALFFLLKNKKKDFLSFNQISVLPENCSYFLLKAK